MTGYVFTAQGQAVRLPPAVEWQFQYTSGVPCDSFRMRCIWTDSSARPWEWASFQALEGGEVVFTALTKRALPLIRYNTHDIASVTHEKCGCGRTLTRMSRITGRSDDMLIIRGVNVFPSQIESVLLSVGQVAPYYMIVVDRVNNLDVMEIKVELDSSAFSDTISGMEELENKIRASIESTLGISSKITFVEPSSLPRSEGKAKRVIDNRVLR